jgi:hypothetical protein
MIGGCPVMWTSKLQTEIALSTMEAEYIALSTAMKELLPMKFLVHELSKGIGLDDEQLSEIHTTVWEDNNGALILANMDLPRMTPRSKHIAVKYHWFQEHIKPENIEIRKIETSKQIADIFTKALRTDQFQVICKLLMGW